MGTFGHPNILAFFLLIMIGCVFFQVERSGNLVRYSWWRKLALLLLVGTLVLTETRSGWGAFLVMGGLYALLYNRRWMIPGAILVFILACTPIVQRKVLETLSIYGNSVAVSDNSSLGWRINTWKDLIGQAMKRPIFGYGINADFRMTKDGLAAHNDYLRCFIESGIIGVLAYFIPYVYLFGYALKWQSSYERGSPLWKLSGFFLCYIPAFLLMSITENLASYVVVHWCVWGLVGIYLGLIAIERQQGESAALSPVTQPQLVLAEVA